MKIAILTSGRYHVCDLARELEGIGHEVAFYSLVPPWQTALHGLPARCNRWLLPYLAPFYAASRAFPPGRAKDLADNALTSALDRVASRLVARCDVFIGMSGMSLRTIEAVRRRFGARTFIERGSKHILAQKEILEVLPGERNPVPDWAVCRELAEYEACDVITVPARHVVASFVARGICEAKLFRNPYGVDLRMFPATERTRDATEPTIVNVGTWSLRKGSDVLAQTCAEMPGIQLLHVGPLGNARFPADARFRHHRAVPQHELTRYYAQGDVFALPSREDGLAMVIPQALASGVPVVCSERSGGEDLKELVADEAAIRVVPAEDAAALRRALVDALAEPRRLGARDLLGRGRETLSWQAYGQRYHRALTKS